VGTAEDVTRWSELRIERERLLGECQLRASQLDTVVAFVPHGLVVQGPQGDVLRMNSAAAKILGYSVRELRGKSFEQQMVNLHVEKADGAPFDMRYFPSARALAGDSVRGVPAIIHPPDGRTVAAFSASPVFVPRADGRAVNTFADITSLHNLRVSASANGNDADGIAAKRAGVDDKRVVIRLSGDIADDDARVACGL
jgi:PAS domain-containing protein